MQAFFDSGNVFSMIIAMTILEAVLLLALYGSSRQGIRPLYLIPNLAAGICLMMALRAAVLDQPWTGIAIWLVSALIAHVIEVAARWER